LDSRLRGNDGLLRAIGLFEEQTPVLAGILKHLSSKIFANTWVCISKYENYRTSASA
jgi:hypothetical protein